MLVDRDIERGSFDGYKGDALEDQVLDEQEVPQKNIEALEGIPLKVKEPFERILTMFISTQSKGYRIRIEQNMPKPSKVETLWRMFRNIEFKRLTESTAQGLLYK